MDVYKALSELHEEKKRLDAAIHALEARMKAVVGKPAQARRGRRSMSAEEREQVSRRMSRYWASRRKKSPISSGIGASEAASNSQQIQEVA
jgi:carboxylesterase type B